MKLAHILIGGLFLALGGGAGGAPADAARSCPFALPEVLDQAGVTNLASLQPVCWKRQQDDSLLVVEKIVLLGRRGTNYVLIAADRRPADGRGRWKRTEISVISDAGPERVIGEREFPARPGAMEIENFKADTWWDDGRERFRTIFEGRAEIK